MDSIQLVKEFHEVFGHTIGNEPQLPGGQDTLLRENFIKEELHEAGMAYASDNLVEFADALGDIQYVLDGWFLNAGLHTKKQAIMEEIHRSNMSKVCKSFEEAQATIFILKNPQPPILGAALINYHIERCRIPRLDDNYIVYRSSDRKVMKSINYSPPDLTFINHDIQRSTQDT